MPLSVTSRVTPILFDTSGSTLPFLQHYRKTSSSPYHFNSVYITYIHFGDVSALSVGHLQLYKLSITYREIGINEIYIYTSVQTGVGALLALCTMGTRSRNRG